MDKHPNLVEYQSPHPRAVMRFFINVNFIYILIPETFIWIVFTHTGVGLSPFHKITLLILTIVYLVLFKPFVQIKVFIFSLIFSISTIYTFFLNFSFDTVAESLEDITRILLLFSTFYYFKILALDDVSYLRPFRKFIWTSFILISANLFLGALGFGNVQRGLGIGTRGFFNAGNDISTVTCIIAAFILSEKYEKGLKALLPYLLLFLFFAYLLNTKAFVIGLVIILAILPVYGHTKRFIRKRIFYRLILFLVTFPFLLLGAYVILDKINFWDPYFAFIDQFQNDSWITFILSRRDEHLIEALNFAKNNFNFFHYLFGYSAGEFLKSIPARTEIDPFEIFFYFGIIGVVAVYGWFFRVIIKSFLLGIRQESPYFVYFRGLFAANVFLFFQSIISGHVFMSVLVCIYLGTLNGILYLKR